MGKKIVKSHQDDSDFEFEEHESSNFPQKKCVRWKLDENILYANFIHENY